MCGAHQPRTKLRDRLRRLGYYWPKMVSDVVAYAKLYHAYHIHGDFIHQALGYLHPMFSSWSFEMWGINVIGPITPPTSKEHLFILAITDYFSKWVEAIPLREVKTSDVVKFIKHHVLYCFGVPRWVIHDNGPQLFSQAFQCFCNKFRIQSVSSTTYYPVANGLAEAFNKIIGDDQTSQEVRHKKSTWLGREAGWMPLAYRTAVRTPAKATPFFLVYGCEVVLRLEIQISSLCMPWQ